MKVILLEDVKKVGKKDEIVEVSQGYGENFLIKTKKAKEATAKNLAELTKKQAKQLELEEAAKEAAKELKAKIEKEKFTFHLNLGNNGNVFGKISTKQIVKKLHDSGYEVDRKKVLTEGINHLGEETVDIMLHKNVKATIKVEVIGD